MKIGFIGFGEVGYEMSKGFILDGVTEIIAYDPLYLDELLQKKADEIGVTLLSSPEKVLQRQLEIVFVAVPAHHTYSVWKDIYKYLNNNTLYVDVSTATASIKKSIFEGLLEEEKWFVDAALMGPLPTYKNRVPTIASGNGVELFIKLMTPYKMEIEKISDIPGDATNIKFSRSIFMKGIAALLFEVLELAQELKVENLVLDSIAKTMDKKSFIETANRLITGTAIHSERRVKEMENVVQLLKENNKEPIMSNSTVEKLKRITEFNLRNEFNNVTPDHWIKVIEKINQKVRDNIESA